MAYTVDWPDAEYHEVLPNLYLGGHIWMEDGHYMDGRCSSISEDTSWDYVVSAHLDIYETTYPQCDMRLLLFDDTEKGLGEDTWRKISSAVDEVVSRWKQGQKVLVRCQAGFNRSGLMMSLVLMRLGYTADGAIELVRRRRGKDVLVNRVFEGYVREREDEYRFPAAFTDRVADWVSSDDGSK